MGWFLPSFSTSFKLVSSCNPVGTLLTFKFVAWGSSYWAIWALTLVGILRGDIRKPSMNASKETGLVFMEIYCFGISDIMNLLHLLIFCDWTRQAKAIGSVLYRSKLIFYFHTLIFDEKLKFTIFQYKIMHKYITLDLLILLCGTEIL